MANLLSEHESMALATFFPQLLAGLCSGLDVKGITDELLIVRKLNHKYCVKTDMSSSVIVSTLYIANATPRDSGNYTCSLGDVATGGVLVHILNGEHPAAMQRNSKTRFLDTWYLLLMSLILSVASLISSDASHSTAQKAQPGAHLNALVNSSAIAR
ncbi:hypothetical protein HAZT_HAZT006977 [Hyalella azteca]|uniref:Immunoglobulin-like beta-sandwich domain-containing protein n=1 Tax=Hyalella azteca TaxID=294128 RepID=A0A6A0H0H9_HYAAZ|nr:hypothetical protein HAZT_HAZT006977 [Hyalella azteca]